MNNKKLAKIAMYSWAGLSVLSMGMGGYKGYHKGVETANQNQIEDTNERNMTIFGHTANGAATWGGIALLGGVAPVALTLCLAGQRKDDDNKTTEKGETI